MEVVFEGIAYEKLPLVDLDVPVSTSNSNRGKTSGISSDERIAQDTADADNILKLIAVYPNSHIKDILSPEEKYIIENRFNIRKANSAEMAGIEMRNKGMRKPHYTRLLIFEKNLIFQAACCLPLKLIAAGIDGNIVYGRTLYTIHSDENGGKLVYEFMGKGAEVIIDLKRGESTKLQRLIFLCDKDK